MELSAIAEIVIKALKFIFDNIKKPAIIFAILFFSALSVITLDYFGILSIHTREVLFPNKNTSTYESWSTINTANKTSNPYATLSIVAHISFHDFDSAKERLRQVMVRTYYTIKPLKLINESDKDFNEIYMSKESEHIFPWSGSEKESYTVSDDPIHKLNFEVQFDGVQDVIKTITTGANYLYRFPLNQVNVTQGKVFPLSQNQWLWSYPNLDDYIDDFTLILESDNVDLSLPTVTQAAWIFPIQSKHSNMQKLSVDYSDAFCQSSDNSKKCTIISKWHQIKPQECFGIIINWSVPTVPNSPGIKSGVVKLPHKLKGHRLQNT